MGTHISHKDGICSYCGSENTEHLSDTILDNSAKKQYKCNECGKKFLVPFLLLKDDDCDESDWELDDGIDDVAPHKMIATVVWSNRHGELSTLSFSGEKAFENAKDYAASTVDNFLELSVCNEHSLMEKRSIKYHDEENEEDILITEAELFL